MNETYRIDFNRYEALKRTEIIDGWCCTFVGKRIYSREGVFIKDEWIESPISGYRFGDLPFTQADQDNIDAGVYLAAPRKKWWEVWK